MMTKISNGIFTNLVSKAQGRMPEIPKEALYIKGIWHVEYAINLTSDPNSPILNLGYIVVQTIHQGCSYYEKTREDPGINEKFIGRNIFEISTDYRPLEIAGLDAVYAHLIGSPDKVYEIDGSNFEKAISRAKIVVEESLSMLEKKKPKKGSKFFVLNVGVVGPFLEFLAQRNDLVVQATDFYAGVVGHQYHGVDVLHGSLTNQLIAEADLAIVTGMTLANGTFDGLLKVAKEHGTKLAMFAETGSNFASEYCALGVDLVISEPLPFYLSGPGRTQIRIFRRPEN